MKISGLLIAAVVLAALLGVLYWSNHHPETPDSAMKASADASPKILSVNAADVSRIAIDHKDGQTVDLARNSSGAWQITSPKALDADQESVSTLLSTLSSLNAERLIADKASNLASYGLAAPPLQVDITLKDNKTQKLSIGDQTPSGNAYYAVLSGDPRLFTVASYNKTSLDKSAADLRDKRLLTTDFDKVSQIELIDQSQQKKQDVTFARNKDSWEILKPGPFRADSSQVDDLVRSLQNAKMESTDDDAKNAAAFKSAVPFAVAKVTGASGTQELQIRKAKDDYYAESSAVPGAYKVAATLATSVDKPLADFRNKKLFDVGYEDPNKIEIHDGAKSYFLTRSGNDWWGPDGKKLDEASVQALLGSIRDLSAEKFPDSGFTTRALEITITSKDGKLVEKVAIAKTKDSYIAKRESEPALYQITSSSISQLEESAANLKPIAPALASASKR
ncbi:MAG: DUF4340 domain-containing protein [Candidatus Acidiferrum sp.]